MRENEVKILLGVTGSISIYKVVELQRLFQKNGDEVTVIMTASACKMMSHVIFETFSPGRVFTEMFGCNSDQLIHINAVDNNDLFVVAPASANIIGKFANGIADDLLSTTFLAWNKNIVIAPAMNSNMLNNPVVVHNLSLLKDRGIKIINPETGELACSKYGDGRLPDVKDIFKFCMKQIND